MSEYPKAKMPDYGDGPEPCEDCAYKDKRIAELEGDMSKAYELIRPYRAHPGLFREVTDILEDCLQAEEMRHISEGGTDES